MGEIVSALAMSHAPGLISLPDAVPEEQRRELDAGFEAARAHLDRAKPDVIIAFINDHFENFFGKLMPTFAIGVGDENYGPPRHYEEWLQLKRRPVPAAPDYARHLLKSVIGQDFDLAQVDATYEFGHNLIAPLLAVRPEFDIPIVPVVTNVFTPPFASPRRSFELGKAIRRAIEERPERVGLLATGALSHYAPVWYRGKNDDDPLMRRMGRLQTQGLSAVEDDPTLMVDVGRREEEMAARGRGIIRPEWDREILDAFARGDVEFLSTLDSETIESRGGNGGHEIRNWITLLGAVGPLTAEVSFYVEAHEWLTGMGLITYEKSLSAAPVEGQSDERVVQA